MIFRIDVRQGGPWDSTDRTRAARMFGRGGPYFGTGRTVTRDETDHVYFQIKYCYLIFYIYFGIIIILTCRIYIL
jgi:hypothetical protein